MSRDRIRFHVYAFLLLAAGLLYMLFFPPYPWEAGFWSTSYNSSTRLRVLAALLFPLVMWGLVFGLMLSDKMAPKNGE
jgi:uncharacterized membrane protein